jgi:rSAM/selenodomain-associated transferase 2
MPLSVIIPTLNAAGQLPACIAALARLPGEVVVVDGGSTDGTADVAARLGALVVQAPRGRGRQLAAGAAAARGDWLLLLHADTVLAPGWAAAVYPFMAANPEKAGYFRFALDADEPEARQLERRVAWRCRRFGLPYGDQGLLISRALLDQVGGIADLPLMEDVDLVRRIGRARLVGLEIDVVTSAVRYRRDGWRARSMRNLVCLSLYFLGVPPRVIARLYG